MNKSFLILLTILQVISSINGSDDTGNDKRVVCYYGGIQGPDRSLYPEDIDASVCTHIIYLQGFINKDSERVEITSILAQNQPEGEGYIGRLVKLKETNPNLKLLLFVAPGYMPWALETADRKTKIIKSAIQLLNRTRFDGLDFSTSFGDTPVDDLPSFFCEMHAEFQKYGYIVSSVASDKLGSSSEIVENMSRCCSFISILTIDDWMSRTNTTRLLAPINQTRTTVDAFIEKGYPANKLLITIPTFGVISTLSDPRDTGLGASIDGPGTNRTMYTDGYTIFNSQLLKRLNDSNEEWTIVRDEESSSPYAYNKKGRWVSFEDPVSAAAKARYVQQKKLGGTLIFTLDMDNFDSEIGEPFRIIRAIRDTFRHSAGANNESQ